MSNMVTSDWKLYYLQLLVAKIVDLFDVRYDDAYNTVIKSAINILIDTEPEYVCHVSIGSWAEEVHEEMFVRGLSK